VTTKVTEKPITFLHEKLMDLLWSLTRAAVKLSLFQGSNLAYSTPRGVNCRTEAVKNFSRTLETCKTLKIILSKQKFTKCQNQWHPTKICFNINLAMC